MKWYLLCSDIERRRQVLEVLLPKSDPLFDADFASRLFARDLVLSHAEPKIIFESSELPTFKRTGIAATSSQ